MKPLPVFQSICRVLGPVMFIACMVPFIIYGRPGATLDHEGIGSLSDGTLTILLLLALLGYGLSFFGTLVKPEQEGVGLATPGWRLVANLRSSTRALSVVAVVSLFFLGVFSSFDWATSSPNLLTRSELEFAPVYCMGALLVLLSLHLVSRYLFMRAGKALTKEALASMKGYRWVHFVSFLAIAPGAFVALKLIFLGTVLLIGTIVFTILTVRALGSRRIVYCVGL